MTDFAKKLRPSLLAIEAYHLKERSFKIKLNQNESPYDLPAKLKKEIVDSFANLDWNRYPSFTTTSLREKLADSLGISNERLIIGNGSNELLQLVLNLALPTNTRILLVTPTFAIYQQLIGIAGLKLFELNLDSNFNFPIDEIISELKSQEIDLCIFCSPNSPTGGILAPDDLEKILNGSESLVMLDEAYHEFSNTNYLELQAKHQNLIITRTFSKALGLAGLRLGYLIGSPDLVQHLIKAKLPYNVNIFSEFVAGRILQDPDLVGSNIQAILKEKQRLHEQLTGISGLKIYPSHANFFMIESKLGADQLFEKLAKRGILIRNISKYHPLLANKLRITVGSPRENDILIESMRHFHEL